MENYFDVKFRLWKEHNLPPEWIESLPYYEYEIWIDKLNEAIDAENTEIKNKSGFKELFNFTKK